MRLHLLLAVLSVALASPAASQGTRYHIDTDSSGPWVVQARFAGAFRIDSAALQVRLDSAVVWVASVEHSDRRQMIGGVAPFIAGRVPGGGWTVWADGAVAPIGVDAGVGDTVRVPTPLVFAIDRSRIGRLDSLWLGFEILLNRLNYPGDRLDTHIGSTFVQARVTFSGEAVARDTGSGNAKYQPPVYQYGTCRYSSLGSAHGEVFLEFAVDTSGRVEPESFRVYHASEPALISQAILDTRPCRFKPARVGRMAIRERQSRVERY